MQTAATPHARSDAGIAGRAPGESSPVLPPGGRTLSEELWREALRLWNDWHQRHEALCAELFEARADVARQAELIDRLDQLDQLRWRAAEMTQELLGETQERPSLGFGAARG